MTNPILLEFEHILDFKPVLLTSKSDKDLIKNEHASLETPCSHYKSQGIFLDSEGHLTPKGVDQSGRNSNLIKILCLSSLSASLTKV